MSRPCVYSSELSQVICARLAEGESLRAICRGDDMPCRTTVCKWIIEDIGSFAARYARARDIGLDVMADEILEIADTPELGTIETDKQDKSGNPYTEVRRADMIEHRKLRIDARRWYLSKLAPKRYGDKLAIEHSGTLTLAERIRTARKRSNVTAGADLV